MKYYFITFLLLFYSITSDVAASSHAEDFTSCEELPFGEVTGHSFGTPAHSNNYGSDDKKNSYHHIMLPDNNKSIFTGVKWQCVEYARRWLIENRQVTFTNVDNAYNIWDLPYFTDVSTKRQVPVTHCHNNISKIAPTVGDLLIYSPEEVVTGHVAVIVGVDNDSITIAEQNHSDCSWEEHEYARLLPLKRHSNGRFQIVDKAVIGWIHIKD